MGQKNGSGKVSRRQKMLTALDLRAAGATYDQIGTAVGVSKSQAWKIVAAAIEEVSEKCRESAERVRALELFRLDKLRMALWPRRNDPRVADSLLRISERVARLHGIDAPAKHELTGAAGGPIEVHQGASGPDLTALDDADLAQLDRIHRKMRKEG